MSQYDETLSEIEVLLRSKRTILYVVSNEENRVMSALENMCSKPETSWDLMYWDIVNGIDSKCPEFLPMKQSRKLDQDEILVWVEDKPVPKNKFLLLVLKDYNKFFGHQNVKSQLEIKLIRHIKNLSHSFTYENKAIIILSNVLELPNDLEKTIPVIDFPLPEKEDLENKVKDLLSRASKRPELAQKFQTEYKDCEIDQIVNSFRGLSLQECEQVSTYCMIKYPKLYPDIISNQKKDIIRKSGLLEWVSDDIDMNSVGGLSGLKYWLEKRKNAFTSDAKEYGLPANPKGLLLVGIQGAGKSLFAKSIASFWNFPLLKLDMGKVFSGLVGSSEQNMRQVFKVAESVAPCILWCDEIDKGLSGSKSSSISDGGTTSRVLGSWLTWMQDRKAPVFVVATANDVTNLPPELLRKGRFDEIFFVDLPNINERKKIFEIHITKRNRKTEFYDIELLSEKSNYFTGTEIESAIEAAMYDAFSENKREFTTTDILMAMSQSVPIAKLMDNEIRYLREWANNRARNASNLPLIANSVDEDL